MRGPKGCTCCRCSSHMKNKIEQNKKYLRGLQLAKKFFLTGRDQSWRVYATNKPKLNPYRVYGSNYGDGNYFLEIGYRAGLRKYGLLEK
jgi:hypothetical protein